MQAAALMLCCPAEQRRVPVLVGRYGSFVRPALCQGAYWLLAHGTSTTAVLIFDLLQGEQILMSYGDQSNDSLLQFYGFGAHC